MLRLRTVSSWKWTLAAINSFENSLGEYFPSATGAAKRGHSVRQLSLNAESVREADRMKESCTAAQNLVHKSVVSCCVVPCIGGGGVAERILTSSAFVYAGK